MHSRFRDRRGDRGSVTAEFALALPAVVLVLAGCLAGFQLAGQQLRLQDAAALAARSIARGGGEGVASRLMPGASITRWTEGELLCVRLSAPPVETVGWLLGLTLTASSCALGGGR